MSGRRRIARDVVMWGFAVLDILTKRRLGMTIRFPWPRDVSSGAMRTTGNRPIVPGATGQALSAGETRES